LVDRKELTTEQEIKEGRETVRDAKKAYEDAVATLSSTQQSVNALLERKHSWTDQDVANFTKLVRSDHASRSAVTTTNEALKNAELAVDKAFTGLMQSILERYHEEQVWSDKIRSVSTWAQVAALVANLIVFMSAIAFIEPWKRRRLVQGLEERVSGMMGRVEGEIQGLAEKVGELDNKIAAAAVAAATATPAPPPAVVDVRAGGDVVGEGEAAMAGDSAQQAEAVAALVNSLLADALEGDVALGPSPLEQVAEGESYHARALQWTAAQLGHVAAPSPERDLAAAGLLGAAAGVAVIGVCSLVAGLLRS
jgi:sensitive to high expression protein 9